MAETIVEKIFIVNCKNCGATLRARAGSLLYRCPACKKLFTIPAQFQKAEEEQAPVVDETPANTQTDGEEVVLTTENTEEKAVETEGEERLDVEE